MSTTHLKRLAVVCVLVGFLFINLCLLAIRWTPPTIKTEMQTPTPYLPSPKVDLTSPTVFDTESFYRTIIDNNLFRPLGWTPARPIEPYRLLGTILPRDANTPPKAIIQTTAGNQTHIVTLGSSLDASTRLVSIESKQVVLSRDGHQRTLRLPSGF